MDLKVSDYTTDDDLTVINVEGEIDVYTAPKLRETLARRFPDAF